MLRKIGLAAFAIVLACALPTRALAASTTVVTLLDNAVAGPSGFLFPPEIATKGFKELTLFGTSSGGQGVLEVVVMCWFTLEAGSDPLTAPSLLATLGTIPASDPTLVVGGFRPVTFPAQGGFLINGSLPMPVPIVAPFYRCRVAAAENTTVSLKVVLSKKRTR